MNNFDRVRRMGLSGGYTMNDRIFFDKVRSRSAYGEEVVMGFRLHDQRPYYHNLDCGSHYPESTRLKQEIYRHRDMILLDVRRTKLEERLSDAQASVRRLPRLARHIFRLVVSPYLNIHRLCRLLGFNQWWVLHPITTYLILKAPHVTQDERERLCWIHRRPHWLRSRSIQDP